MYNMVRQHLCMIKIKLQRPGQSTLSLTTQPCCLSFKKIIYGCSSKHDFPITTGVTTFLFQQVLWPRMSRHLQFLRDSSVQSELCLRQSESDSAQKASGLISGSDCPLSKWPWARYWTLNNLQVSIINQKVFSVAVLGYISSVQSRRFA